MENGRFHVKQRRTEMEENNILVCEDSNEAIFTAVYEAYERHLDHAVTKIQIGKEENLCLFSKYITIKTDTVKAEKVIATIRTRFGMEATQIIFEALASNDPKKGQAVYQTIVFGLLDAYKGNLMDCIYHDAIAQVVALSTTTWYELHHFYGFLRFEELEGGVLFSKVHPKNNLLTFMGPHFSNRLPNENFVIFDETRDLCLIHAKKKEWYITSGEQIRAGVIPGKTAKEMVMQELFCHFCHKIAIKERENKNLQRQMLPLRFRDDMIEFSKVGMTS